MTLTPVRLMRIAMFVAFLTLGLRLIAMILLFWLVGCGPAVRFDRRSISGGQGGAGGSVWASAGGPVQGQGGLPEAQGGGGAANDASGGGSGQGGAAAPDCSAICEGRCGQLDGCDCGQTCATGELCGYSAPANTCSNACLNVTAAVTGQCRDHFGPAIKWAVLPGCTGRPYQCLDVDCKIIEWGPSVDSAKCESWGYTCCT